MGKSVEVHIPVHMLNRFWELVVSILWMTFESTLRTGVDTGMLVGRRLPDCSSMSYNSGVKATGMRTEQVGSTGGGRGVDGLTALGLAVRIRVDTACVGATSLRGVFRGAG